MKSKLITAVLLLVSFLLSTVRPVATSAAGAGGWNEYRGKRYESKSELIEAITAEGYIELTPDTWDDLKFAGFKASYSGYLNDWYYNHLKTRIYVSESDYLAWLVSRSAKDLSYMTDNAVIVTSPKEEQDTEVYVNDGIPTDMASGILTVKGVASPEDKPDFVVLTFKDINKSGDVVITLARETGYETTTRLPVGCYQLVRAVPTMADGTACDTDINYLRGLSSSGTDVVEAEPRAIYIGLGVDVDSLPLPSWLSDEDTPVPSEITDTSGYPVATVSPSPITNTDNMQETAPSAEPETTTEPEQENKSVLPWIIGIGTVTIIMAVLLYTVIRRIKSENMKF